MSEPTIVNPGIIEPTTVVGPWVQGPPGTPGADGAQGPPGPGRDIDDASVDGAGDLIITYSDNTTQNAGHVVGADGANGTIGVDGANAYVVAVEQGFSGTPDEWLASLQGEDGEPGTEGPQGPQGPAGNSGITSATLTGDVTGTLADGEVETTLTNSGVVPGAYKGILKTFGVDEKGRVTGVGTPVIDGDLVISENGGDILTTLVNTTVTPGQYSLFGFTFTVDAKGRLTNAHQVTDIAASGDMGLISGANSIPTFNLSATGVSAGTYTKVTVNAKGRVTAGDSLASGDVTTALGFTPISGNQTITLTGDITGSGSTAITTTLKNSGVTAGTYTNATFVTDAQGRITNAVSTTITASPDTKMASVSISAGVLTLDCSNGVRFFKVPLNANITSMVVTNVPAGEEVTIFIEFTTDGTGRSITMPSGTTWFNDIALVPTSANGKRDLIQLYTTDTASSWIASIVGQAA